MTPTTAPVISILTTCYNREKYLAECIQSVLDGHFQDFELIIVDDQSTDRSLEIANDFAAQDSRIRVYRNEKNLGDYPNRNKAASYARGKYIKYLDADDMHGRFMVDIMVDAMETFPEAGYGLFDYGDQKPLFPIVLQPSEAYEAHYSGKHRIFNRSPINAIIKKEIFEEIGGFSGKQHVGDFELWHQLSAKHPTVVMSAGPGLWREHDNQQSSDNRTDPLVPFKYQLLSIEMIDGAECPLNRQARSFISTELRRRQARTVLMSFKNHGLRDALKLKQAASLSWSEIIKNAFANPPIKK